MKWHLLFAGLLWPGVALADPITAVAALAPLIGGTAAAFIVTNFVTLAFIGIAAYGSVSARRKARRAAASQRAAYNASLQDRSVTALSATPPWRVNYGRFIAGGDIIDVLTSDKTVTKEFGFGGASAEQTKPDAYKHLVIHLATHEIEAIHEVYIDGIAVGDLDADGWATGGDFAVDEDVGRMATFTTTTTLTEPVVDVLSCYETEGGSPWVHTDVTPVLTNGNLTVTVPTGKTVTFNYTIAKSKSTVRVRKFLGSDSQSAESYLQEIAPNTDSTGHHLRGIACVVVTLDLEEPRFQGGANQITIDRSGKKLYDPRTRLTEYSNNPALCVRDFLVGEYGYDCTDEDIDDEYTIAAANACDVVIPFTTGTSTSNGATFTCNGMVTTDGGLEAQLEELCESMAGSAVYGARWMIMAGAWTPPVTLPGGGGLTDADLDGQIEIVQAGPGVDELFSGCRGTFVPSDSSQPTDADPYQNATFLADDGRALWNDFTLPFTNTKARAKNLFRIFTERARIAQVIRYPAKLRAWPLRVGDRVLVTSEEYSFVERSYRVTDWQFGITSPVLLTLERDVPEVWDQADAATANLVANSNLPNPWLVAAITGLAASSSTSTMVKSGVAGSLVARVLLSWDDITDSYVKNSPGYIEILWRRAGQDFQRVTWPGDQENAEIVGVNDGDRLIIKVRAVNGIGGVGPWSYLAHTVNGPTTVGTVEIDEEAATAVRSSTATGVAIGARSGVPNTAFIRWNSIADISYTPDVDGEVVLHASGEIQVNTASSGTSEDIASAAVCLDVGVITTANIVRCIDLKIGYSETIRSSVSMTRRFAVSAGLAYTMRVRGQGGAIVNNDIIANQFELRMEFIKR